MAARTSLEQMQITQVKFEIAGETFTDTFENTAKKLEQGLNFGSIVNRGCLVFENVVAVRACYIEEVKEEEENGAKVTRTLKVLKQNMWADYGPFSNGQFLLMMQYDPETSNLVWMEHMNRFSATTKLHDCFR